MITKGKMLSCVIKFFQLFLKLMYGDHSEELVRGCLGLKGEGHLKFRLLSNDPIPEWNDDC